MKKLRILANIPRFDYGNPALGNSFEYDTFFKFFEDQGHVVDLYDYTSRYLFEGQKRMAAELIARTRTNKYDLIFTVPFTNQFSSVELRLLTLKYSRAISVAWMCDDKWRWESYSKYLAHDFDYVVTTDPDSIAKYLSINYNRAILSQWAHNPTIYRKYQTRKKYDVSFVGGISPWRAYVIDQLKKQSINVHCFGSGWENGRVTLDDTVEIYNQSKIVLNLSNSTQLNLPFLFTFHQPHKFSTPKETLYVMAPGLVEYLISKKRVEDIKARFFEVTGAGAFLLSYSVKYLDRYLTPGKEFVQYESLKTLVPLIRYYLKHDAEREKIALAGYHRTHSFHTYGQRFEAIFRQINYA